MRRYRWVFALVALGALISVGGGLWWFVVRRGQDEHTYTEYLWFADITDEVGLDFANDPGDVNRWDLPQINGSGVAVFDYDGDGKLDLYFLNMGGKSNRLYKNIGGSKFVDATEGSGLGTVGENTGVIVGDVNNDGKTDVVVVQVGGVRLFLNNGNGSFSDASEVSGLKNPLWGTSANLFDFDKDGWLDLVVVNYLENDPTHICRNSAGQRDYCGPVVFPGTVSRLFRNLGGQGKPGVFEDVTVKAGLAKAPGPGLAVFCADFDGDGWPDIFIANDAKPNHLWINQKDGTFKEEAYVRGIAVDGLGMAQAGMGIAVADVDGDGLFDVYVTHLANERNVLWQQGPKRGRFEDRTARSGLSRSDWRGTGFGTVCADFDNDGWPDIAVANGAVARGTTTPNPALGSHWAEFSQRNQLFRNLGGGRFADVSRQNRPFCGTPNVARGIATGDLDGDGGLDVVLTTVGSRARVYRNVARERGHWLIVRAVDPRYGGRDAYGAELVVKAGTRDHFRIINPGDSFQCSSDPRAHVGLGVAVSYDSIEVLWPDGLAEVFPPGSADRVVVLTRGQGKEAARGTKP